MTIAPLLSDSELLLTYGAPMRLARTAICATRGRDAAGSEYFDTRGELVWACAGRLGEMTIRFAEPDEEALALILGERIGASGVVFGGGAHGMPQPMLFALGYEASAVESEARGDTHLEQDGHSGGVGVYERTWLYKCRARLGQYARERAGASPKAVIFELIVTPMPTLRRFAGAPVTSARMPPGADASAGRAWFDEVYIPEDGIWTS